MPSFRKLKLRVVPKCDAFHWPIVFNQLIILFLSSERSLFRSSPPVNKTILINVRTFFIKYKLIDTSCADYYFSNQSYLSTIFGNKWIKSIAFKSKRLRDWGNDCFLWEHIFLMRILLDIGFRYYNGWDMDESNGFSIFMELVLLSILFRHIFCQTLKKPNIHNSNTLWLKIFAIFLSTKKMIEYSIKH